ncbi:glutamate synthase domain-containing protein 1 [Rhizobium leguminosarum]|uniref:Glutamate synthase domain-containing protein 1 n=1 Tax=Rhizobium leguminosarum TaxID=384 RepID=A0AAE2MMP5_RHILE|nr:MULTISPECIES: glutamine amidotransferase family protein [Rhizobium]MBB4291975.1 glutamate synthase domain-containing protein 1 [Rhizobium leguminosarum]MBB4310087.1 glutamate synthase domain-containing protein 1 [Rhizobium leguminosarum]MBB4419172.1 glutamate synthase domain-containing protein 1 [Rhizobium leguminosarum]MBB4433975.1 glutamate synthase domain-containing protein 1 [Rhizobium esperanzae]MBB4531245.1 glutamate synthase domain-containing protein 1 [Rhizobium leguminosarum]
MCGIVGLFLKDKSLEPQLGSLLSDMLITMTDRGPDSAGIAIYGGTAEGRAKITIQSANPGVDFDGLAGDLEKAGIKADVSVKSTHAVIELDASKLGAVRKALEEIRPAVRLMGSGESVEIYKEIGLPKEVVARFGVRSMSGTHGIGHTRMATESAVTTLGAHPFSTGADQCLVHNGSLSNHNNLRRELVREGMTFETQNDSEVAAAYLTAEMAKGKDLGQALTGALDDLDGFFTFVVGTKSGFGVVRDPIACKPAVMAETEQYVAFGSEYRALVNLPGIENARVWEPEPATVYFWDHDKAA